METASHAGHHVINLKLGIRTRVVKIGHTKTYTKMGGDCKHLKRITNVLAQQEGSSLYKLQLTTVVTEEVRGTLYMYIHEPCKKSGKQLTFGFQQ